MFGSAGRGGGSWEGYQAFREEGETGYVGPVDMTEIFPTLT